MEICSVVDDTDRRVDLTKAIDSRRDYENASKGKTFCHM